MPRFRLRTPNLLKPAFVLAFGSGLLQAQPVTVKPSQVELRPGGSCQFEALLDPGPDGQRPGVDWTLEAPDGHAAPDGAGRVDAHGFYHAPDAYPAHCPRILVKVTVAGASPRSGSGTVIFLPAADAADEKAGSVPRSLGAGQPKGGASAGGRDPQPSRHQLQETKGSPGISLREASLLPQIATLKPRAGLDIPTPAFSLAGLDDRRKMSPQQVELWQACLNVPLDAEMAKAWRTELADPRQEVLPPGRYALFHGIGMSSQRRLLQCYYENADELSTEQVFALSPWVVLGLRNAVSCTLIDVTCPRTWYPIGFLLDVPLECIFTTHPNDAFVPMEFVPYDQQAFRRKFLGLNPFTPEQRQALREKINKHIQDHGLDADDPDVESEVADQLVGPFREEQGIKPAYGPRSRADLLAPAALLGNPRDPDLCRFNEVGVFSRITDPERSVRITAVVITGSGKYATAVDAPDVKPDPFYENLARQLAERLHLPLFDLRRSKGTAAGSR